MKLKLKIQELVINKIRLIPSRFDELEIKEIYNRTNFLTNAKINERCYNILHDVRELVTCKQCLINKPTYLRISVGYRLFCSDSCKNIWVYNNTDTKNKISKSVSRYHSTLPNHERRIQQDKRKKSLIKSNYILCDSERSEYELYMMEVNRYTNENDLTTLPHHEKRGRVEIPGTYHLDHKYSIFQGFRDNISPKIIGSINNLEFIPSRENVSKREKCSISLEELMDSYK